MIINDIHPSNENNLYTNYENICDQPEKVKGSTKIH